MSNQSIQFFIRLGQQVKPITFKVSKTVAELQEHLNRSKITISHRGRQLKPEQTLASAGLKSLETLTVNMPLVGGVEEFFGFNIFSDEEKHYYEIDQNVGIEEEKLTALRAILSETSFFMGLTDSFKGQFLKMFEADQIEKILKIDTELGYSKESTDVDRYWIYESLNNTYPVQRHAIVEAFQMDPIYKAWISDYFRPVYGLKSLATSLVNLQVQASVIDLIDPATQLITPRRLTQAQETSMNAQEQADLIDEKLQDKWANTYQFEESTLLDRDFVDKVITKNLLPPLSVGQRLQPITEHLTKKQCLQALEWFMNDEPSALSFLESLSRSQEAQAWDLLTKMWPSLEYNSRRQVLDMINKTSEKGTDDSLSDKLVKMMLDDLKTDKGDSKKRSLMNMIWNSLNPEVRKEQAIKISQTHQSVAFLKSLDLNNKVEFLSHLSRNDAQKKIFDQADDNDAEKLKSEVQHHQFFHLNEGLADAPKDEVANADPEEQNSRLPELGKHLEAIEKDMQKAWQYVPFDMPGDYLQCIPNPHEGKDNHFVMVQPVCQKNLADQDFEVHGTLKNETVPKRDNNLRRSTFEATQAAEDEENIESDQFSIISFWNYTGVAKRTYDCYHSFASPPIVPWANGSSKSYKKTYLFKGNGNQISYFCEEGNKLFFCTLKLDADFQNGRSWSSNVVTKHEIKPSCKLYQMMKPRNKRQQDYNKLEAKFHQTPPTLLDCGEEEGMFLVFSYFKYGDAGPSLYFYSLKQQAEVSKVAGGEFFIDFVTDQDNKAKGKLYFLIDQQFLYQRGWKSINSEYYLKKRVTHKDSQFMIVHLDFRLDQPVAQVVKDVPGSRSLQLPDGHVDISPAASDLATGLSKKINRTTHMLKEMRVLKTNKEMRVYHLAVTTEDKMSQDQIVHIYETSEDDQLLHHQQSIDPPQFYRSFITRDNTIQVILRHDETFEVQFYEAKKSEDGRLGRFEKLPQTKHLTIPVGSHFIPQELILKDNIEIFGCFLDKDEFAIHWFEESLSSNKFCKRYQTEEVMPKFSIEYPIMSYTGPYPDSRELTLVNLADLSSARTSIQLKNMQFICQVNHRSWTDRTKVCFLAYDYSESEKDKIVHCIINCEKMFQKKLNRDLSYYSIEIEPLGSASELLSFQKELKSIVQIESVHEIYKDERKKTQPRPQCYVIQYEDKVCVYTKTQDKAVCKQITQRGHMKPVCMRRGFNNTFYYVESDITNSSDILMQLTIQFNKGQYSLETKVVYELNSGAIIALENDPDNDTKLDEGPTAGDGWGSQFVSNELFLIDDSLQLLQLKQGDGNSTYEVIERQNLNEIESLALKLRKLKTKKFSNVCITEDCIEVMGQYVDLHDKLTWEFKFESQEPQYESDSQKKTWQWQVHESELVQNSHRQKLVVSRSCIELNKLEYALVVKPLASSRKICLVGQKGLRAVETIEFISNDLLLLKLRGNYWSMMNKQGQIHQIPRSLLKVLNRVPFDRISTKRLHSKGKVLLILESEKLTTTVLFDHSGNVCETHEYETDAASFGDLYKPGASDNKTNDQVYADDTGTVFRIFNVSQDGEIGDIDEQLPKIKKVVSKQSQELNSHSDSASLRLVCFFQNKSDDDKVRKFLVCGEYICQIVPESSCIIRTYKISECLEGEQNRVDQTNMLDFFKKSKLLQWNQSSDDSIFAEIDMGKYMKDRETKNLDISIAPLSTHLSQRKQSKLDHATSNSVNESLLQLTINNRIIIFDLADDSKKVIKDFSDSQTFLQPDRYVCSEVNIKSCYSDESYKSHTYRFTESIVCNHSKDFFYAGKKWRTIKKPDHVKDHLEDEDFDLRPSYFTGAYKTYCEMDLIELKSIHENLVARKTIANFDLQCILSTYMGHTIFTMEEQDYLYQLIEKQLKKTEFDPDENDVENHQLRRLYQILMTPKPVLIRKVDNGVDAPKQTQIGMYSVLEMIPYSKTTASPNKLLKIANMCSNTSLIKFVDSQNDARKLLDIKSNQVIDVLENSFYETVSTREITSMPYPDDQLFMAFKYDQAVINKTQCEEKLEQRYTEKKGWFGWLPEGSKVQDWSINTVKVKLLDLGWLFADEKNFLDFIDILQNSKNNDIYMTNFVKTILDVFWTEHKMAIIKQIFVPYVIYLASSLYYMIHVICVSEEAREGWETYLGAVVLFFLIYQLRIEFAQFQQVRKKENAIRYFTNPMNIVDLMMYLLNAALIVLTFFRVDIPSTGTRRVMGAIVVCLIWSKMFDWMRMFDATSFYIKLIIVTIQDILPFFLIFPVFLMTFGSALFILNTNRDQGSEVIDPALGYWAIDAFINQYLLSLGEFEMDHFDGPQVIMIYVLFFLATFLTQVTALNMIIAIMGATFDKVQDSQQQHEREMKISLLGDYINVIIRKKKGVFDKPHAAFLVLVMPDDEDSSAGSEWEGSLSMIRATMASMQANLQEGFKEKISSVKDLVLESKARQTQQDKETKKFIQEILKNQTNLVMRMDEGFSKIANKDSQPVQVPL